MLLIAIIVVSTTIVMVASAAMITTTITTVSAMPTRTTTMAAAITTVATITISATVMASITAVSIPTVMAPVTTVSVTTIPIASVTTTLDLRSLLLSFRLGIGVSLTKNYFSGKLDAIMFINCYHFDFDDIANLANFFNLADELVFEFTDMAKAITTGQNFDEGAEILDGGNFALIDFANLDFLGDGFNLRPGCFSTLGIAVRDEYSAIVLDIDFCTSRFLDAFDVFATWPDKRADLFRIDFYCK